MEYDGWTVEMIHEDCLACVALVQPCITMAEDWGFGSMGSQATDDEGITHNITIRRVVEP